MTGVPNHTRHSCGKNGVGDGKGGGAPLLALPRSLECVTGRSLSRVSRQECGKRAGDGPADPAL